MLGIQKFLASFTEESKAAPVNINTSNPNQDLDFFDQLVHTPGPQKPQESLSANKPTSSAQKVPTPSITQQIMKHIMNSPNDNSSKKRALTDISQIDDLNLDTKLMDMLVTENRQLKSLLESRSNDMQALIEKATTLQMMESECQEENEVLRYKVMSMEAEIKMQNGRSLQDLQIVDQLHSQNKELSRQVVLLTRDLQLAHKMLAGEDKQTQTELDVCDQTIQELKSLYTHFQIDFDEQDEMRVLKAIYVQDKPVIRMYRELLFQKVAKRAIESAEFMLKRTGQPKQGEARLFIENRKIISENARLKQELAEATELLLTEKEERQFDLARASQKLQRVNTQANQLSSTCAHLKQELAVLKRDFQRKSQEMRSNQSNEFVQLQQKISDFAQYQQDQCDSLQEAHNDLYQENTDLHQNLKNLAKIHEREISSTKLTVEREITILKQQLISQEIQMKSLNEQLQNSELELGEAKELVEHLGFENHRIIQEQSEFETNYNLLIDEKAQLIYQLQQTDQKVQSLMLRTVGSPGSGSDGLQDDLSGISFQEALVMLIKGLKSYKAHHLFSTMSDDLKQVNEKDKMLEEREEEIQELMKDYNQRWEVPESQNVNQRVAPTLPSIYTIEEEGSSIALTEDFIGFEAEKLKPLTVIQSRSSNPNENVNKLADVDIPKRQLTIDTLIAEPKIRSDQIEMDFFSQLVQPKKFEKADIFDFFSQPVVNNQQSMPKVSPKGQLLLDNIFSKLGAPLKSPTGGKDASKILNLDTLISNQVQNSITRAPSDKWAEDDLQIDEQLQFDDQDVGRVDDEILFDDSNPFNDSNDLGLHNQSTEQHGVMASFTVSSDQQNNSDFVESGADTSIRVRGGMGGSFAQKEVEMVRNCLNQQVLISTNVTVETIMSNLEETIKSDQQESFATSTAKHEDSQTEDARFTYQESGEHYHSNSQSDTPQQNQQSNSMVEPSTQNVAKDTLHQVVIDEIELIERNPRVTSEQQISTAMLLSEDPFVNQDKINSIFQNEEEKNEATQYNTLAELANKIVKPQPLMLNETAAFNNSSARSSEPGSPQDSSYFTRNQIVINNATYGQNSNINGKNTIAEKFMEQFGEVVQEQTVEQMSFAINQESFQQDEFSRVDESLNKQHHQGGLSIGSSNFDLLNQSNRLIDQLNDTNNRSLVFNSVVGPDHRIHELMNSLVDNRGLHHDSRFIHDSRIEEQEEEENGLPTVEDEISQNSQQFELQEQEASLETVEYCKSPDKRAANNYNQQTPGGDTDELEEDIRVHKTPIVLTERAPQLQNDLRLNDDSLEDISAENQEPLKQQNQVEEISEEKVQNVGWGDDDEILDDELNFNEIDTLQQEEIKQSPEKVDNFTLLNHQHSQSMDVGLKQNDLLNDILGKINPRGSDTERPIEDQILLATKVSDKVGGWEDDEDLDIDI